MRDELDIVTGAFGFTGKYITRRLLALGRRVRTLTGHPTRENPFGPEVSSFPFNFDHPQALTESLRGATTLYNTYWIRFPRGGLTFDKAVQNTEALIKAAEEAGVRRFVHISIASASEASPLPYFRGKGLLEKAIIGSKLSYAILRPTVIFGAEDVLVNNIAWLLRRFPFFAIGGGGDYRVQPVYVEDVAEIAVHCGQQGQKILVDAVGPETYTFDELVRAIAEKIGGKARILHVPSWALFLVAKLMGPLVKDIVLTGDEIKGLMAGLLVSSGPATGRRRFSEWLEENAEVVGARYRSELNRHYR